MSIDKPDSRSMKTVMNTNDSFVSIITCKICNKIPSRIDLAENEPPPAVKKLKTIWSQSKEDRYDEEYMAIRQCPVCASYYYYYYYEDYENTAAPYIYSFIKRYNLFRLKNDLQKFELTHEFEELKSRYQINLMHFIDYIKKAPDKLSTNIKNFIIESIIDYYIFHMDWINLSGLLLNNQNPDIILKTIHDLINMYGKNHIGHTSPLNETDYHDFKKEKIKNNKALLVKHKTDIITSLISVLQYTEKDYTTAITNILKSAEYHKYITVKKAFNIIIAKLSDNKINTYILNYLIKEEVDIYPHFIDIMQFLHHDDPDIRQIAYRLVKKYLAVYKKQAPLISKYLEVLSHPPSKEINQIMSLCKKKKIEFPRKTKKMKEKFKEAVYNNDSETIMMLLQNGIKQRDVFFDFPRATFLAIKSNNMDLLALLLEEGPYLINKVNSVYGDGVTPLINAVIKRRMNAIKLLLKAGADVNAGDSNKKTPLMYAAEKNLIDYLHVFIEAGAAVNAKDTVNNTAAIYAVIKNKPEALVLLIEKGIDLDINGFDKKTALIYAVEKKNNEMVTLLLNAGADVNGKDSSNWTPLIYAVEKKLYNLAETLLNAGANINCKISSYGYTPLMIAAKKGDVTMVQQLLARGAKIHLVSYQWSGNKTALMLACAAGKTEVVALLLEKMLSEKVKIDKEDYYCRTALDYTKNKKIKKKIHDALLKQYHNKPKRPPKIFEMLKSIDPGINDDILIPKIINALIHDKFDPLAVKAVGIFLKKNPAIADVALSSLNTFYYNKLSTGSGNTTPREDKVYHSIAELIRFCRLPDIKNDLKGILRHYLQSLLSKYPTSGADTCEHCREDRDGWYLTRRYFLTRPSKHLRDIIIFDYLLLIARDEVDEQVIRWKCRNTPDWQKGLEEGRRDGIKMCPECGRLFIYTWGFIEKYDYAPYLWHEFRTIKPITLDGLIDHLAKLLKHHAWIWKPAKYKGKHIVFFSRAQL